MKQSSLLKYFSNSKPKTSVKDDNSISKPKTSFKDENQAPEIVTSKKRRLKQIDDDDDDVDVIQQYRQMDVEVTPLIKMEEEIEQRFSFSAAINSSDEKQQQSQPKKPPNNKPRKQNKKSETITDIDKTNIIKENKEYDGLNHFEDATPEWAQQGKSKDSNKIPHSSVEADPTTLFIPDSEFKKLTKSMQQYWTIKRTNFDKVIFFKLGKFYELFYDDAMIGHKYLELNWMGKKMYSSCSLIYYLIRHTGFPEKCIGKYSQQLIVLGFKVAVVDQVETPDEMERRIKENRQSGVGNTEKIVQRELSQVLTKGTYQEEDEERYNPDERILMVIRKNIINSKSEEYGIAMLESQTNVITLAYVENEEKNYEKLKTLLLQTKPLEVVVELHNVPMNDQIVMMLRNQAIRSIISPMSRKQDNWDCRKALFRVEKSNEAFPESVEYFRSNDLVMSALNGLFSYLESVLILDRVLESARYKVYDPRIIKQGHLILDSQALYHLEILESSSYNNKSKDFSLMGIIDKTVTGGGHRMLRKWLCSPLYDVAQINQRQDCIEDLCRLRKERDLFRQSIKQLPDLERVCSRIYQYSVKQVSKAIFYENLSQSRLKEFKNLIMKLREAQKQLEQFGRLRNSFKSERLRQLVTVSQEMFTSQSQQSQQQGMLPDVVQFLDEFETYIEWKENVPQPQMGVLQTYDEAKQKVKEKEAMFDDYLKMIRQQYNYDKNITYAHVKFRYELEIPSKFVEVEKPDEFEFSSARNGYQRFHTKKLKDMVFELEEAEEEEKKQLTQFVQFVFKHFQRNYQIWDTFVSIINELDALCSMSVWCEQSDGKTCRPKFLNNSSTPILNIVDGRHPSLSQSGISFIPNSIEMGVPNPTFLLISGPNMGGKSTTLRMSCILVILAQMGSMVPCESMELTPVDRIFTRIGAYDQLMEGKSTFYVELEETLVPLRQATRNSLFISDELGRGTSTYDGVAIASSVMKYLIDRIGCRVLFATHFRILIEEAKLMQGVVNVHMACYIENDNVVFLYRLRAGECPGSFGINVAKAVGMPSSIIERAREKAHHFDKKGGEKNAAFTIRTFNEIINNQCIG